MYRLFFIFLLFISTLSYADEYFSDELQAIYKQQYQLRSANLHIKNKLERSLYLDVINSTNSRQRYIARLIEKLTKNYYRLEEFDNKLNYIDQMAMISYSPSHSDSSYAEELKEVYKQQLRLKNKNLNIKGKIDNYLKFDAINNTNIRQRHVARLAEIITRNNDQLEALDNRLIYIEQVIMLENRTAFVNLNLYK